MLGEWHFGIPTDCVSYFILEPGTAPDSFFVLVFRANALKAWHHFGTWHDNARCYSITQQNYRLDIRVD